MIDYHLRAVSTLKGLELYHRATTEYKDFKS
jgi:hypothetical protein